MGLDRNSSQNSSGLRICTGEVREDFLEEVMIEQLRRMSKVSVTWAEEEVGMVRA